MCRRLEGTKDASTFIDSHNAASDKWHERLLQHWTRTIQLSLFTISIRTKTIDSGSLEIFRVVGNAVLTFGVPLIPLGCKVRDVTAPGTLV